MFVCRVLSRAYSARCHAFDCGGQTCCYTSRQSVYSRRTVVPTAPSSRSASVLDISCVHVAGVDLYRRHRRPVPRLQSTTLATRMRHLQVTWSQPISHAHQTAQVTWWRPRPCRQTSQFNKCQPWVACSSHTHVRTHTHTHTHIISVVKYLKYKYLKYVFKIHCICMYFVFCISNT